MSQNGNYLLNIGPDGTGVIPTASLTSLREMGNWLAVHGPAIYGTDRPNPLGLSSPSWGWYTTKGQTVYAVVKDWPTNGYLELENLNSKVTRATLLSSPGTTYGIRSTDGHLTVTGLPATAPNSYLSVLELSIEGEVRGRRNLAQRRPVTITRSGTGPTFQNSRAVFKGARAVDGNTGSFWRAHPGTEPPVRLTVDLDGSQTFNRIVGQRTGTRS